MARLIGVIGLFVLLPVLGGCGFAVLFIPDFPEGVVPEGSVNVTAGAEGYLVTGPLFYGRPETRVQRIVVSGCSPSDTWACGPIQITENPSDEEFWQFEARIKMKSGIPYGRSPSDFLIVGSESHCEEIRALFSAKGTPTERCKGPHYFKEVDATTQGTIDPRGPKGGGR